jgi:uncharacterized protein (DUF2344 family)
MRSGLDLVYSEGFNPHPKIVFAQPLSIYQESEYEIFDFKLNRKRGRGSHGKADCFHAGRNRGFKVANR